MNTLLSLYAAALLFVLPFSVFAREHAASTNGMFVENKGQVVDSRGKVRPDIAFTAEQPGMRMFFSNAGIHYVLERTQQTAQQAVVSASHPIDNQVRPNAEMLRVDMELLGANRVRIVPENAADSYRNFYYAHCPEGIVHARTYNQLIYPDVYRNIDLVAYRKEGGLKYDFVVRPGGNAGDIRLRYNGATSVAVLPTGDLEISTPLGSIGEQAPEIYQQGRAGAEKIDGRFVVSGGEVRFAVDKYDPARALIIDPAVQWSTYLGGTEVDAVETVVIDKQTDAVVVKGLTTSSDFPITPGAVQLVQAGNQDLFVSKFNSKGQLLWSTYYGGSSDEGDRVVGGVACAANGDIVFVGSTASWDFPVSDDAFQSMNAGDYDMCIVRLDQSGSRKWATYFGGHRDDRVYQVDTDTRDNIVLSGSTSSANFPVARDAAQPFYGGGHSDAVLAKFNASGELSWATYCGGNCSEYEWGGGLAIDHQDNIVLTGVTNCNDFPVSNGAFQTRFGGKTDILIVKYSAQGARLWATLYGGRGEDHGRGAAVDSDDNIIIGGGSQSDDFPVSDDAYQKELADQPSNQSPTDAVFIKLTPEGKRVWATYYGAIGGDVVHEVVVDNHINTIWAAGSTSSRDFPVSTDALQQTFGGANDVLILRMDVNGRPRWATYYGGKNFDDGFSLAVDSKGAVVVAGRTYSHNFPITENAFQKQYPGGVDGFVLKLGECIPFKPGITASGPLVFCEGENVSLEAAEGYDSYRWSTGETTRTIVVKSAGTYSVSVVDDGGCAGMSAPVVVVIAPRPQPAISIVGSPAPCEGDNVTLVAPPGYTSYLWSNGATTSSITVSASGVYSVVVDNGNCPGTSATVQVDFRPGSAAAEIVSVLRDGVLVLEPAFYHYRACADIELRNNTDNPMVFGSAACVINTEFSVPQGQFPLTIEPRSTAFLTVCYVPLGIAEQYDTLVVGEDCGLLRIPLAARGKESVVDVVGNCDRSLTLSTLPVGEGDGILSIGRPYPNPAAVELFIPVQLLGMQGSAQSVVRRCELLSSLGDYVADGVYESATSNNNAGVWRFDTSLASPGVYMVVLDTDAGVVTCPVAIVR